MIKESQSNRLTLTSSFVVFLLFMVCNTGFAQEELNDYQIILNNNKNVVMNKKTFKELLETIEKQGSAQKADYCCACTSMTPASVGSIKAYNDAHAAAVCYNRCCYQDICGYGCRKGSCK